MLILTPLAFLRRLDSLRHTSFVALFAIGTRVNSRLPDDYADTDKLAYLLIIVVYGYFYPLEGTPEPGEIRLIHFNPAFLSTFPVQVFAFTCAQNVRFDQ